MKKVLIAILITIVTLGIIIGISTTATSEAYIPSETQKSTVVYTKKSIELTYIVPNNFDHLQSILLSLKDQMASAHSAAEKARANGAAETDLVICNVKEEYMTAFNGYVYYYNNYYSKLLAEKQEQERIAAEAAFWGPKEKEYPYATYIWKYLKNCGYNNYVIAGIIGNLMAEVGGQTLNIQYWLKGSGYYGMCQWSKSYCSGVWGKDLAGQCEYLQSTIRYELNTFGFCYKKGFNYDGFCELTNEQSAALAFAKCYERCASFSYTQRQKNASKALAYFTK